MDGMGYPIHQPCPFAAMFLFHLSSLFDTPRNARWSSLCRWTLALCVGEVGPDATSTADLVRTRMWVKLSLRFCVGQLKHLWNISSKERTTTSYLRTHALCWKIVVWDERINAFMLPFATWRYEKPPFFNLLFLLGFFSSRERRLYLSASWNIFLPRMVVSIGCWAKSLLTLPKTNIAPENRPSQKETVVFQPSIFRCEHVSFQGGKFLLSLLVETSNNGMGMGISGSRYHCMRCLLSSMEKPPLPTNTKELRGYMKYDTNPNFIFHDFFLREIPSKLTYVVYRLNPPQKWIL